jgi:hypothetical protein
MDPQHQPLWQPEKSSCGDFVSLCLSFFLCFLFLGCTLLVITCFYHPDTSLLLKEAEKTLLPQLLARCKPEPIEKLLFTSSVFLTPIFLFFSLIGISKRYAIASYAFQKILYRLSLILATTGSILATILVYKALAQSNYFYIRTNFFFIHPVYYSCLFFPCLLFLIYYSRNTWIHYIGSIVLYGTTIALFIALFFTSLWNSDTISPWVHHLNPLLYPQAQISQGKTLLVDCPSLYGLFPHFLAPIFLLIPLNVYSFSVTMSILFLSVVLSIGFFLKKNTRNDLVFLVGFLATIYCGYMEPRILSKLIHIRPDPFFQYAPLRMLFPYALLALSAVYQTTRHKKAIYTLTSVLMSLSVLWNFDSGIVAFFAWNLFLAYGELFHAATVPKAIRPILKHLCSSLVFLFLVVSGYSVFAFFRTGTFPDWIAYFQFYTIFSSYGFFQMPMPSYIHLWMVVVMIYIFALLLSIHGLLKKEHGKYNSTLFLLAIVGTGLFSYYQGRSHDANLYPLLITPILIVTLLIDHTLEKITQKNKTSYLFIPLSIIGLYFCASSIPSICLWGPRLFHVWTVPGFEAAYQEPSGFNARNIDFIKKHTHPGEPVVIYSDIYIDGIYHAETKTRAAMNLPASTEWLLKSDMDYLLSFLATNKTQKVFVLPGKHPANIVALIQPCYTRIDQDAQTGIMLLLPNP